MQRRCTRDAVGTVFELHPESEKALALRVNFMRDINTVKTDHLLTGVS